ncbi:MAG TPA: FUSC family protein [Candidatus Sulfotelmatobacter sp.]|nr:FUSC family protein [Candidatus Sulfotelmatobacter sp.]
MATRATPLRDQLARGTASWGWFREFIRWEVAPYPGRVNTVIRMTIAATLVMVIVITFRIPNAFLGALFAILLARENLAATWHAGRMIVVAFVGASLYTLLGMILFRGYPITHFFWVIGSLFLLFFVMRTTRNYAAALAFAIPIGVALPVWDRSVPSEAQVEGTLWPVLVIAVGAGVTVGTEALYRIFDRSDPLIASVDNLLLVVQQVAESLGAHHALPKPVLARVVQYDRIGTGRLRMMLQRQGLDPTHRAQRSALISLAGRLIGLAANIERSDPQPSDAAAMRLRALSQRLEAIRKELRESGVISASAPVLEGQPSSSFPMLQEMERIVALMTRVFQADEIAGGSQDAPGRNWWRAVFQPDTFENPEYKRFAFAGCLAASICYVLYNALDWPGIGTTAVLTCIVTALTTIGTSFQAQFLRLAGFVVGGLIMGISAQILILPGIDSIFGFTVFFAAGTAIAAWFATSSPRLSFFGVQIALSFYFVNLQDSQIQTDLTIARDKVIGVLLGILAMGFVFDRFGTKSDKEQLQKLLVRNVQMLAQLGAGAVGGDRGISVSEISRLRSQINDNFASLESQTDTARFEIEFRHRREGDVAECQRIQKAQPALRSIYLLELSLLSHREVRESGSELTEQQNQALDHFLKEYSDELTYTAAWIAHKEAAPARISSDSVRRLQQAVEEHSSANAQAIVEICEDMVSSALMLRNQC